MKIDIQNVLDTRIFFELIEIGKCFRISRMTSFIYMKTEEIPLKNKTKQNCLCLNNGHFCFVDESAKVYPVEAELKITDEIREIDIDQRSNIFDLIKV